LSWHDPIQNLAELGQKFCQVDPDRDLTQLVMDKIWKYSAKSVKFFGGSPMDTNLDPHPLFGSKIDVD